MLRKGLSVCLALLLMFGCVAALAESKNEGQEIDKDYTKEQAVEDTGIATEDLSDLLDEARERSDWVDESLSGEMEYWTWDNAAPYYAEAFTKHYPNVVVTVNVLPDYWTKVKQALASGAKIPDAAMVESGFYQEVANSPAFEDLEAEPYNAGAVRGNYLEFWWDNGIGEDGVLRVVPNAPGMAASFYRRDIANELLGTDDPDAVGEAISDWDKVYELGIKLRDLTDGTKFIVAEAYSVNNLMILQSGKTFVMDNQLNLEFLRPCWEMALKFRQEGLDCKYGEWTPEGAAMMKNGEVFMYQSGSWFESYCIIPSCGTDTDGLWGVTTMPVQNVSFGGNGFAIPAQAERKDLGWAFINFSISDLDMQADQLKRFSCYPGLIEAQEDPYFDLPVPLFDGQIARRVYGEIGKTIVPPARQKDDTGIRTIVDKYFGDVLLGNIDIDSALIEAEDEVRMMYPDYD